MPFSWYHPDVPAEYAVAPEKRRAMLERELREHASLLRRLGYGAEEATERLVAGLRWDFELHDSAAQRALVRSIVHEIFTTRRTGVGGPPSVDG